MQLKDELCIQQVTVKNNYSSQIINSELRRVKQLYYFKDVTLGC